MRRDANEALLASVAGADPGLLVFDSRLTTYPVLDELSARGIRWLTLRRRARPCSQILAALPDAAWKTKLDTVKGADRKKMVDASRKW